MRATNGRASSGRATDGWQFSPAATIAREATARLFGPLVAWMLHGPRVVGAEHLVGLDGPLLVCPNHASHLDFSALRLALGPRHRRRLAAAAAADYFRMSPQRWFFAAWLGAFPFARAVSPDSMAAAELLLGAGWSVVVFPEGTRSRTGEMGPFRPGVGLLAVRSGRPVLPVRISGTWDALPPGRSMPRRSRVEVRFGPPLVAEPGEQPRAFVARLEQAVRAL
jgi:1-acyl-sn-glycerol-3-phosphate acyltransferase